jgi:hypothetical protein
MMKQCAGLAAAALALASLTAHAAAPQIEIYSGPCDASAATALDAAHFVVGADEGDTLHIYRRSKAEAVASIDLSGFLGTKAGEESDIEAATTIGSRIYWITSHGRNGKGEVQRSRHRFFATDIVPGQPPTVKPAGKPYTHLLRDMEKSAALKAYKLDDAARLPAEAAGGLNIEGLAATPEGTLLIGFRNPLPQRRALILPLLNPAELIVGKSARFGVPIELDLGRRGIRSIERFAGGYLIVAGPAADTGSFALFKWSGKAGDAVVTVAGVDLGNLHPEALFATGSGKEVQLLSDDGGILVGGVECKKLPKASQTFRSLIISP